MVEAKFGVRRLLIMAPLLCLSACGGHSMTHSSTAGAGGTDSHAGAGGTDSHAGAGAGGTDSHAGAGAGGTDSHAGAGGTDSHAGAGGTDSHAGTGGTDNHAGAGGTDSHAGTGGTASHAGAGGVCPTDLPDAAQLAATPRANTNLELLALKFSSGVVADQAIYDRLVRDVALISAQNKAISDIEYFPPHDGKELLIIADAGEFEQMRAGTYHAWDCLNDSYGVEDVRPNPGGLAFTVLTLEGIYNLDLVSKQYAALPGIASVGPDVAGGDGPTICVVREDGVWHYVFDRAGGDCPAGCTEHEYTHFTVTTAGGVDDLGRPSPAEIALYASREACR